MKNLFFSLLIFFLVDSVADANVIWSQNEGLSESSVETGSVANGWEPELSDPMETSQTDPQTISVPPTTWVVSFGLCLVFLGYLMKNKVH